jgi:hypothetical protein
MRVPDCGLICRTGKGTQSGAFSWHVRIRPGEERERWGNFRSLVFLLVRDARDGWKDGGL